MTTFKEFAEKHRIEMSVAFKGAKREEGWEHLAFDIVLARPGVPAMHQFTTIYKTGMGHALPAEWKAGKKQPRRPDPKKPLRVENVLESLAVDAAVIHHDSFESWAGEYGYDTDSRKAEKTYRACRDAAEKLTWWLGIDVLSELLSCTEE